MASGRKPPRQSTLDAFVKKSDGSLRDQSQKIRGRPIRHAGGHVRHSPITSRPEGRTPKTEEGACEGPTRIPGEQGSPTEQTKPSLQPCTCATKAGGVCFSEVKGDLFSCPDSASLVHCVSEDMNMGKGVAVLFKRKFGGVAELKSQGIKTGGLAVLQKQDRYIYYMVTKPRYFHKPTYDTLHSSLQALHSHCISNGVKELCMPRIGCGLDRLKWERVSAMIQETFADSDISITVYVL